MSEIKKLGMYGERESIKIGRFTISSFDGTEAGGVWIEDTEDGDGGQFRGHVLKELEHKIKEFYDEYF